MTYKAAIFDFDGVIADTESVFADFDCALLNDVMVQAGLSAELTPAYIRTLAGNNEVKKLEIIADKYGFDADAYMADFKATRDETRPRLFKDHPVKLGKGVKEFVAALNGDCALATNKSSGKLFPDLKIMGIDPLFKTIVPCDPPLKKKPAPDILFTAAVLLGFSTDECVYIGDNVLDMQAASAAGMDAIGFVIEGLDGHGARADALREHGAIMVVDDFAALYEYFEALS